MTRPRVLSIAGSDPSGGAGIQADLKTMSAFGVYGMAVITALTAQNTQRVSGIHVVPAAFVEAQAAAVCVDCPPAATKIGMLGEAETVRAVASLLERTGLTHVVLDPVAVATSGDRLVTDGALAVMLERLVPVATLVTPNRAEARLLTGVDVRSVEDAVAAARWLLDRGARAVLVKGGDVAGEKCVDVLVRRGLDDVVSFRGLRVPWPATHGTGCTLSTAIACGLALGDGLVRSVTRAKAFVEAGLRAAFPVGAGAVPLDHVAARDVVS